MVGAVAVVHGQAGRFEHAVAGHDVHDGLRAHLGGVVHGGEHVGSVHGDQVSPVVGTPLGDAYGAEHVDPGGVFNVVEQLVRADQAGEVDDRIRTFQAGQVAQDVVAAS